MQGFRVVGSGSKLGREYPVRAFRLGGPVELARLLDYIPDSNGEQQRLEGLMRKSRLSLAEAKEKYPDWYERRIVKKERRRQRNPSITSFHQLHYFIFPLSITVQCTKSRTTDDRSVVTVELIE